MLAPVAGEAVNPSIVGSLPLDGFKTTPPWGTVAIPAVVVVATAYNKGTIKREL